MPRALLVHPWIHDFAAHDFWLRPLGLLRLAGMLRSRDIHVDLVDCLDMDHPAMAAMGHRRERFGKGKLYKEEILKPPALSWFPRKYSRYGLPPCVVESEMGRLGKPDVILLSSGMTYWYTGLQETIGLCRRVFSDAPIVVGGTYATLCCDHAREHSGADLVVPGDDWREILQALSSYLPVSQKQDVGTVLPAWDLLPQARSIAVKTSEGCPYRCAYCASKILSPEYRARSPEELVAEIDLALKNTRAEDVAFYDDALLWSGEERIREILEGLKRSDVAARFHCPNGLHARFMTAALAKTMGRHRFETIRLGLESARWEFHDRTGSKIFPSELQPAVEALRMAGYRSGQIGAYVMAGLPGQGLDEIEESVRFVIQSAAVPYLAEFSPIPGTAIWEEACEASPFPIQQEPLFHNNTILPCGGSPLKLDDYWELKASLQRYRNRAAQS